MIPRAKKRNALSLANVSGSVFSLHNARFHRQICAAPFFLNLLVADDQRLEFAQKRDIRGSIHGWRVVMHVKAAMAFAHIFNNDVICVR